MAKADARQPGRLVARFSFADGEDASLFEVLWQARVACPPPPSARARGVAGQSERM